VVLVFVIWAVSGVAVNELIDDPEQRGTFGDMFGAVNALFSGLAFAGIIYTIMIQRKELSLQRKELALQREEVRNATTELAGQKEQMIIQRFEHTFFNLLSMNSNIVTNLRCSFGEIKSQGTEVFMRLHIQAEEAYGTACNNDEREAFNSVFKQYNYLLSHYLKSIDAIVDFVHINSILSDEEKKNYISLLTSQLSQYELLFIFFHGLFSPHPRLDKFCHYNFFASFDRDMLLSEEMREQLKIHMQNYP
jgi:hypothetical protein